ncbi:hypothetical protein NEF87_002570 [Candidatus Lokiarchaeum ossiferum]|uniref:Histidine kinase N-terminal 7TM region domain-containing protein n=1 Tax=Candidatus Lokiarchaeum ossiferum TaxID=2951803 RepID=A0ABY6HRZ8_9ARCH|nr:hypothetical protein NEF87_002570 [Candidatus Lokiarchaeum sp. B-35]
MIQQLTNPQIQTFVFNGIIIILFVIFSYFLLKRNRNRLSMSLTLYFLTISVGLILNIIYRAIDEETVNIVLNIFTIYFTTLAGVQLLNFVLNLYFSSQIHTLKRQLIYTIIYAVALLGLPIIGIIFDQVSWGPIAGVPIYEFSFGFYGLICSQIIFVFIIYYAMKIKTKMGANKYSTKFMRSIVGILCFDLQLIGAYLAHTFGGDSTDSPMRLIGLIFQLIFILPGAFLLYFGLKKEPEN